MNVAVEIKWSKAAERDVDLKAGLQQQAAIAQTLATWIRDRTDRGEFASEPKQFSVRPGLTRKGKSKANGYYISPAYAEAAGVGNKTQWHDSKQFHDAIGAKAGRGRTTHGMWSGLQVRNFGDEAMQVEFGGSTLGAKSTRTVITKAKRGSYDVTLSDTGAIRAKQVRELHTEGGEVKYRRKPRLVRNNLKAHAVFQNLRIGLLQPTDGEIYTVLQAFRHHADMIVRGRFGAYIDDKPLSGASGVTSRLYQAQLNNFQK